MGAKRWTQQQLDLLINGYAGKPFAELVSLIGRSQSSIHQKAWELGIARPHDNVWTAEDRAFLAKHYAHMPISNLVAHLSRTPKAIRSAAKAQMLPKIYQNNTSRTSQVFRIYQPPQDIFQTVNHQTAYVIGYILSDGCIHDTRNRITISSTDKIILEKIRDVFGVSNPLSLSRKNYIKPCYVFGISDKTTVTRLAALNIGPRKSLTATLPPIEDAYFFDFLRGFFDGDGNVYLHTSQPRRAETLRRRYLSVTLASGSRLLLEQLASRIASLTQTVARAVRQTSNKRAWILTYWNRQALALSKNLYKHAGDLCLARKQDIFRQYEFVLQDQPFIKSSDASSLCWIGSPG